MADMDYKRIEDLLESVKPIVEENEQLRAEKEAQGGFFNIFSILGVERNEVHTHSAFLAELLNPKGSHGLKDAFLKLFVKEMSLDAIEDKSKLKTETATVRKEFYVGKKDVKNETGGDIDILIEFSNPNYTIVIENKIDAGDQEAQLARYRNYAKKYGTGFTLFYLTKDGHEPSEWSTGKETNKHYWRCISYARDIKTYSEKCLDESEKFPLVNAVIRQYMDLIDKLTGQELDRDMDKKVVDLMLNYNEEILAVLENLYNWQHSLFENCMKRVAEETDCKFESDNEEYAWIWDENYCVSFTPNNFSACKIWFENSGGGDAPYYYLKKDGVSKKQKTLECMSDADAADDTFHYGSKYFDERYLKFDIHTLVNGEFKDYMVGVINKILNDPNFPK